MFRVQIKHLQLEFIKLYQGLSMLYLMRAGDFQTPNNRQFQKYISLCKQKTCCVCYVVACKMNLYHFDTTANSSE